MFSEEAFEDEERVTEETEQPSKSPQAPPPRSFTVHFHKPGEEGFCSVAGAGEDVEAVLDARTISGDSWVNDQCHCLRCECLRVMQRLDALQRQRRRQEETLKKRRGPAAAKWPSCPPPLILLLLDLDNFGFNQFKSVPPGSSAAADEDEDDNNPLTHVFVWAFFGSCFTRYHRTWPTAEAVCEPLPSSTSSLSRGPSRPAQPPRASIWQRLVRRGHVHFTPCAGQSQAADGVIMSVLDVFTERDVILLTGDTKLLAEIYSRRRVRGRKSRRENEKDMMSNRLTLIDVNDNDKRFVPVWRDLEHRVRQIVQNARSRMEEAAGEEDDD